MFIFLYKCDIINSIVKERSISLFKYMYDLHVHSTDSDGKYSKVDLLEIAKLKNIKVIAFCDHNSYKNLDNRIIKREYEEKYHRKSDSLIIPSIEISAGSNKYRGIHILGYGLRNIKPIKEAIDSVNIQNVRAMYKQIELINREYGIPITVQQVIKLAMKNNITSKDLEEALIYYGYIGTKSDMYKFTNKNSKSHVDKVKISDIDSIKIIHKSGGIAILAHPIELKRKIDGTPLGYEEEYENYIKYLLSNGLDGIETHTIKHNAQQQAIYYKIANKYNLLTTAGTDFHDEKRTPQLGVTYNPNVFLKPLLIRIKEKNEREEGR